MQDSSHMSKTDNDIKENVKIKEEENLSNSGSNNTPTDTNTPRTGMPMDSTTPRNGMPMDGTTPRTGMPMDGTTPRSGMPTTPGTGTPMNGTTPRTGMPMNGTTPRTGMPINGTTPRTGMPITPRTGMPINSSAPGPCVPLTPETGVPISGNMNFTPSPTYTINSVYMPKVTPYNTPMGVPLYPLYGYDNCEDVDKDINYFKQMYPYTAKQILKEIDNECDQLEYDGSIMFDEYPDKVAIDRIVDRIYEKVKDIEESPRVEINSFYGSPRRRENLLRDIVSIILLNELINRRRRYRRRRRWF